MKRNRWRRGILPVLAGVLLVLAGCRSQVRTEEELIRYALAHYGDCQLVETTAGDKKLTCCFRDGQYGFEYTVTSAVTDVGMDGTRFFESESTYDDFAACLTEYALAEDSRFREIEGDHHAVFETLAGTSEPVCVKLPAGDAAAAQQAGEKAAAILREYERDGVYGGKSVSVYHEKTFLGKCSIPDGVWTTAEQENEEFFTGKARCLDRSAVLVRVEKKTFGDMGLPLSEVNNPMWDPDQITDSSSPVTCYYFRAGDREFVIADFYVKKADDGTGGFYTDYYVE